VYRTVYSAGELTFEISTHDRLLDELMVECLGDLRSSVEPRLKISLSLDEPDGVLVEVVGQSSERHRTDEFLPALVSLLNRQALDADSKRLHLHAAALTRAEHGVVFAAAGGTGKSTLAAALGQRRWTYISDEMVTIGSGAEICGFPKPITLRSDGAARLGDLSGRAIRFPDAPGRRSFLPASRIPTNFSASARASMLVFLRKAESSDLDCTWSPLTSASATVMAIGNVFDFERFGEEALRTIGNLCLNTFCVDLQLADLKSTTETIEELVDGLPKRGVIVHCSDGPSAERVKSIVLNDEVVLHNTQNNRVVSLPPESSKEWLRNAEDMRNRSSALFDELRRIEILTDA